MSWARLDDQFATHAKVVAAGNLALGCWVRCLAWCAANLTDGLVPCAVAEMFSCGDQAVLDRLCEAGMFDRDGSDYLIHDYLEWNPSGAQVRKTRKERAKAGARGGKQRASKLLGKDEAKEKQKSAPSPSPSPSPMREETGAARLWPESIGGAADLEAAVAAWGWQAGNLSPQVIARVKRLADAGPIARHEYAIASAKTEDKVPAGNGAGRVRYFLGVVEGNRRDAVEEASRPTAGPTRERHGDTTQPAYLRPFPELLDPEVA